LKVKKDLVSSKGFAEKFQKKMWNEPRALEL
jgi:hypothetical protein